MAAIATGADVVVWDARHLFSKPLAGYGKLNEKCYHPVEKRVRRCGRLRDEEIRGYLSDGIKTAAAGHTSSFPSGRLPLRA